MEKAVSLRMERCLVLTELVTRIAQLELSHPVRVAVDGVDAAGKTMLADELRPSATYPDRDSGSKSVVPHWSQHDHQYDCSFQIDAPK